MLKYQDSHHSKNMCSVACRKLKVLTNDISAVISLAKDNRNFGEFQ